MKAYKITDETTGTRISTDLNEFHHASIQNMLDADFSQEDLGIHMDEDGEYCDNENGEIIDPDFELVEGYTAIAYWTGNEWKTEVFESFLVEEIEIESEGLEDPNPAYYFRYLITFQDGQKREFTSSNMSGNLSPFISECE